MRNRADKVASKRRIKIIIIIIIIIRNGAKTISLRHFVFGDLITIIRTKGPKTISLTHFVIRDLIIRRNGAITICLRKIRLGVILSRRITTRT